MTQHTRKDRRPEAGNLIILSREAFDKIAAQADCVEDFAEKILAAGGKSPVCEIPHNIPAGAENISADRAINKAIGKILARPKRSHAKNSHTARVISIRHWPSDLVCGLYLSQDKWFAYHTMCKALFNVGEDYSIAPSFPVFTFCHVIPRKTSGCAFRFSERNPDVFVRMCHHTHAGTNKVKDVAKTGFGHSQQKGGIGSFEGASFGVSFQDVRHEDEIGKN